MLEFLICATLCAGAFARPNGAPAEACGDMLAQHGTDPQDDENPYSLSVVEEKCPSGAEPCFAVTISGTIDFRGFFIQARYLTDGDALSEDQIPVGSFEFSSDSIRHQDCLGESEFDSVTHSGKEVKSEVIAHFNPDGADLTGLQIVATVVEEHAVFYYDMRAAIPTAKQSIV